MSECRLCPRRCGVDREQGERGFCGETAQIRVARAALHMWEEPCISGEKGSGTVFFTGCSLRCVYCQNHLLSTGQVGKAVSAGRLAEIFLELQDKGAANINLVTPTHFAPWIAEALREARRQGLRLPIVYNTGGYERVETLRSLEGCVDIYLTDLKYLDPEHARRYSQAADYPEVAKRALAEMVRQVGAPDVTAQDAERQTGEWDSSAQGAERRAGEWGTVEPDAGQQVGEPGTGRLGAAGRTSGPDFDREGMMRRGVIVRHLLLPGCLADAKRVVAYLHHTYGERIWISLMNQYTPLETLDRERYPQLARRVRTSAYERLVDYAISLGVERAYIQEGDTADESFIPPFTLEGV